MFRAKQPWEAGLDMETSGVPRQGDGNGEATVTEHGVSAAHPRVQVTLFDAHDEDRDLELGEVDVGALGDHQLLWIDLVGTADADLVALLDRLGVPSDAQPYLLRATGQPCADDHGGTLHVEVAALVYPDDCDPISIVCLVGNAWVVTSHEGEVPFLDDFRRACFGRKRARRAGRALVPGARPGMAADDLQRRDRDDRRAYRRARPGTAGQSAAPHGSPPANGKRCGVASPS
jgi:hypothetical protein